jgi:monoamine oxidase
MRGSPIVRRALEQARRQQRHALGLPPPLRGTSGIGRRTLLKLMAAAAGTAALPLASCARTGRGEVAIVGGGMAGLVALRTLTDAGIPARLYEARRRIGGRVFTRTDFAIEGSWVEMGGQLVNSDHADMIALVKEFGLELVDRKLLGGVDLPVLDRQVVAEATLAAALGPIAAQIAEDSERLDTDWEAVAPELDALSVAAYLDRHGNKLGDATARRLLEQSIRTEFGAEPDEASAIELIWNLPTVDGQAYELSATATSATWSRADRSGSAMRSPRPTPTASRPAASSSRWPPADGGGVTLRFATGEPVSAERVILTVPPSLLAQIDHGGLLTPEWQAFAEGSPPRGQREAQRGLRQQAVDEDADGGERGDLGPRRGRAVRRSLGVHRRPDRTAGGAVVVLRRKADRRGSGTRTCGQGSKPRWAPRWATSRARRMPTPRGPAGAATRSRKARTRISGPAS